MPLWLKKILLVMASILLLLSGGWMLLLLNADKIKTLVIEEINENLLVKVELAGETELCFFSTFPNLSLKADKITASSGTQGRSIPLFRLQHLLLYLDIPRLLRGEIMISGLELSGGSVDLFIPVKGNPSYAIFHQNDSSADNRIVSLKRFKVNNCRISYADERSAARFVAKLHHLSLKGNLQSEAGDMEVDLHAEMKNGNIQGLKWFLGKPLNGSGKLSFNRRMGRYEAKKFLFEAGALKMDLSGGLYGDSRGTRYDLSVRHSGNQPMELISLLPDSLQTRLAGVIVNGDYQIGFSIRGVQSKKMQPKLSAEINIEDMMWNYRGRVLAEKIHAEIKYSSDYYMNASLMILIKSGFALGAPIRLGFTANQLSGDPEIDLSGSFSADLAQVFEMSGLNPERYHAEGILKIQDLKLAGRLSRIKEAAMKEINIQGSVALAGVAFTVQNVTYGDIHGVLDLKAEQLKLRSLRGKFLGTSVSLSGSVYALDSYIRSLVKREPSAVPLRLDLDLVADRIDLARLINAYSRDSTKQKPSADMIINYEGETRLKVSSLIYKKINVSDMRAAVLLNEREISVKTLDLKVFNGDLSLSGDFKVIHENEFQAGMSYSIRDIDLRQFLQQTDQLEQSFITDANIKGYLQSSGSVLLPVSSSSGIDWKHLQAQINIDIEGGELIELKALKSLSSFIRLEELSRIRFQKLTNQILISDGKVTIPDMEIQSSALNLRLSGTHTLENEMDYRLKVNLRKVLAAKFKRINTQVYREDDPYEGTNLMIRVYGSPSSPKFTYDRSGVSRKLEEEFRKEKEELKSLFKKEDEKRKEVVSDEDYYFQTEEKPVFLDLDEKPKY